MLMGYYKNGGAALVDLGEQLDDLIAHFGVDVARRLVGDDERGVVDQSARKRHALLLAARKLGGVVVSLIGKTYKIDYGDCPLGMSPTQKYFPEDGRNYLMPIPRNEITKSKGTIEQNPGY